MGAALGRVLGPSEAKRTTVALGLLLTLIKAPEKVMAAAICAGLRSPSPRKELVREES